MTVGITYGRLLNFGTRVIIDAAVKCSPAKDKAFSEGSKFQATR